MSIKISLAGDLGSGKSTVSKILVERLGATYYSTGAICREVAASHGMSVVEMNVYMETHPELDHEIDDGVRALSHREENLIIDSRMAFHFVEGSFRVYMATQPEESARRELWEETGLTLTRIDDVLDNSATRVKAGDCMLCGKCVDACPTKALSIRFANPFSK